MADDKKYFIRKLGSTFSTTMSSGTSKLKRSDGWIGFKTLAERDEWRRKHKD